MVYRHSTWMHVNSVVDHSLRPIHTDRKRRRSKTGSKEIQFCCLHQAATKTKRQISLSLGVIETLRVKIASISGFFWGGDVAIFRVVPSPSRGLKLPHSESWIRL